MDNETTGETQQAAAADETLGEALAPAAGEQTGEEQTQEAAEEKTVPLAALEAERGKRQQAEQAIQNMNAQMSMMQQTQIQQMPQQAQDYFAEQGLEGDDLPTADQIREYGRQMQAKGQQQNQQATHVAQTTAFMNSKKDYSEMVGQYNYMGQFEPSKHFTEILNESPGLAADYQAGRMTAQAAYRIAKGAKAQKDLAAIQGTQQQQQQNQNVALRTGPLPASSVGGGGAVNQNAGLAGLDMNDPADRQKVIAMASKAEAGDYDE